MGDFLSTAYSWLKDNDLPNWGVVLLTVILVPLVTSWWNSRKVNTATNLLVSFERGTIRIGDVQQHIDHPAVYLVFSNHTGSVVYVNGPRLTNCSANFPIPTDAARDIAENWYVLSFVRADGGFGDHQVTLQTGAQAKTGIAVKTTMPDAFYQFQTSWLRRVFRRPKYFTLEYSAMVGDRKYSVATIY